MPTFHRLATVLFLLVTLSTFAFQPSLAQADEVEEKEKSWTNETDLSLVLTEGNSRANTVGLTNLFQWKKGPSHYIFKVDGLVSNTADDTYVVYADPNFFLSDPTNYTVVEPPIEEDIEKYLVDNNYKRNFTDKSYWTTAVTWDRNLDAGILSRWVGFGGIGRAWFDKERVELTTSYGLSYTDREEEEPDPEKEDAFSGFRLLWHYKQLLGKVTTIGNDFSGNLNFEDTQDYTFDTTTFLAVKMSGHLSLRISVRWLYNNEPSLDEVDAVANVDIPGFGPAEVELGDVDIRRKQLDTVFKTSLAIDF